MPDDKALLETLIAREKVRRDAWLNNDAEALRDLLTDEYVEVNLLGRLSRDQILEDIFPYLEMKEYEMSDFRLARAGTGAAAITYHCRERWSFKGEPDATGDFHVSAVYTQVGGEWHLLLWSITPYGK
jgi:hypothetical protein